jgi:lipopolysaccharide export LptBFGC system permease protein LptF
MALLSEKNKKLAMVALLFAVLYYFVYQGAQSMLSPFFSFAGAFSGLLVAFVFFLALLIIARWLKLEQ